MDSSTAQNEMEMMVCARPMLHREAARRKSSQRNVWLADHYFFAVCLDTPPELSAIKTAKHTYLAST